MEEDALYPIALVHVNVSKAGSTFGMKRLSSGLAEVINRGEARLNDLLRESNR